MQCLFLKGKLKTKQNPSLKGGSYWVYILRKVLGLLVEAKGASTTWANMVHGPTAQKTAAQRPDRFWTSYCFGDSCRLRMNLGLKLVPLEAPWNYISIHIKIIPNRLRIDFGAGCSWTPKQTRTRLGLGLQLGLAALAGPPRFQTPPQRPRHHLHGF